MQRGLLADYFDGVARKRLAMVEVNPKGSNQHELNATVEVKRLLGLEKRTFQTQFMYFEGEQAAITEDGFVTFYDARKNHPKRSEHRIYFNTNLVTEMMEENDTLFFALRPDNKALFIVAAGSSTMAERLSWLFDMEDQADFNFDAATYTDNERGELDFLSRQILDLLGIEYEDPKANEHDTIIEKFDLSFPKTKEFSELARLTLPQIDARDDPDFALIAWLDHEEALFRRLEKRIVSERLLNGFVLDGEADVDAFVQFSLSVQNRRKSRMGHSLENHIAAVLDAHDVEYSSQFRTMKGKKPDFIFPNSESYSDFDFPIDLLTMLAAKSSCKERWSQVLSEADRIPKKHLLTLDPGIPEPTTNMMQKESLQLIVPTDRHSYYSAIQRGWLMSVADFIVLVKSKQQNS
jgi:hypothetical protein